MRIAAEVKAKRDTLDFTFAPVRLITLVGRNSEQTSNSLSATTTRVSGAFNVTAK